MNFTPLLVMGNGISVWDLELLSKVVTLYPLHVSSVSDLEVMVPCIPLLRLIIISVFVVTMVGQDLYVFCQSKRIKRSSMPHIMHPKMECRVCESN